MTPKTKAEYLVGALLPFSPFEEKYALPHAKQSALICVDEMRIEIEKYGASENWNERDDYWLAVKEEIMKVNESAFKQLP